jgi:hypothetical protein
MVHVKDHDGADRVIAETEVVCGGVDHRPLCPANVLCGPLSLGKVAATNQQGYVGMGGS